MSVETKASEVAEQTSDRWHRRFADHGVWASLEAASEASAKTVSEDGDEREDEALRDRRLQMVIDEVRRCVRSSDPWLVSDQSLTALKDQADQLKADLDNYAANGQPAHLEAADAKVDQLVTRSSQLPGASPGASTAPSRAASARLEAELARVHDSANAHIDDIRQKLSAATDNFNEAVANLEQRQEERAAAETEEMTARDGRAEQLNTQLTELQENLTEITASLNTAEETEREKWRSDARTLIDELGDLRDQASNLVEATSVDK